MLWKAQGEPWKGTDVRSGWWFGKERVREGFLEETTDDCRPHAGKSAKPKTVLLDRVQRVRGKCTPSGWERQAGVRSQMACLSREGVCTDPKGNGVRQKVLSKGMISDACCLPSEFMVFIRGVKVFPAGPGQHFLCYSLQVYGAGQKLSPGPPGAPSLIWAPRCISKRLPVHQSRW